MKIRYLGERDFAATWQAMHDFTLSRDEQTEDELWVLEHPPVFTQGLAGKAEHILHPHDIPVIQTDRGGQVTYHGPGQIVAYILLDVKRAQLGVRQLVTYLEKGIIDCLAEYGIHGQRDCSRPGVYVSDEKIASIGLRIKRGCCFHGISFNVAMDLTPFTYINPCGYAELKMTQMKNFVPGVRVDQVKERLAHHLCHFLS